MMQASDAARISPRGSSSDFVGALNEAIRQNPIPAALVGVGILWLFAGGRNIMLSGASQAVASGIGRGARSAGTATYQGARAATGGVADGIHAVADSASEIGAQATEAVSAAAGAMRNAVSRTVESAGGAVSQASDSSSKENGDTGGRSPGGSLRGAVGTVRGAQDALADLFARQPLALGAVGIAIGAAIAASLPKSQIENRLLGETADTVKDQAGKLWDETTRRGADLASKGLDEAEAQGLTPAAAAQAVRIVTDRVAGLADKTMTDIVDRMTR